MKCYFIISCARSGSTSLSKILNTATNGVCASEPMPNLTYETRLMMENNLHNVDEVLEKTIIKRVKKALNECEVYGEKNVTYGPFIKHLYDKLNCKFVFLKRDGRDSVSSMINWHEQKFGNYYREAIDSGNVNSDAWVAAQTLLANDDMSDFSRPRPLKGDVLYHQWSQLSRFEMCSYYWSFINELYLTQLSEIPSDAWIEIDYSTVSIEDILKVGNFLGLEGLEYSVVDKMLNKKINSLEERGGENGKFSHWSSWNSQLRENFDRQAEKTMLKLAYYNEKSSYWKPDDFGKWWEEEKGADSKWFEWMYGTRIQMHQDLISWVNRQEVESIADFGCGVGVGYHEAFSDKNYIGVDISSSNIEWAKRNRKNKLHQYICRDFVRQPLEQKVDLVFSSGTIDNSYDVKAFLASMIKSSNKWIYLTLYRGYFPEHESIDYGYNKEQSLYYNDIPVKVINKYLKNFGCSDIKIEPMETGRDDIIYETRIIAHV